MIFTAARVQGVGTREPASRGPGGAYGHSLPSSSSWEDPSSCERPQPHRAGDAPQEAALSLGQDA